MLPTPASSTNLLPSPPKTQPPELTLPPATYTTLPPRKSAIAAAQRIQRPPSPSPSPSPPPPRRAARVIHVNPATSSKPSASTSLTGAGVTKSSSTSTTKKSKKTQRKTAHSLIERRRRGKINDEFEKLRRLVPACQDQNERSMHKLEVLKASVDYLEYLKGLMEKKGIEIDDSRSRQPLASRQFEHEEERSEGDDMELDSEMEDNQMNRSQASASDRGPAEIEVLELVPPSPPVNSFPSMPNPPPRPARRQSKTQSSTPATRKQPRPIAPAPPSITAPAKWPTPVATPQQQAYQPQTPPTPPHQPRHRPSLPSFNSSFALYLPDSMSSPPLSNHFGSYTSQLPTPQDEEALLLLSLRRPSSDDGSVYGSMSSASGSFGMSEGSVFGGSSSNSSNCGGVLSGRVSVKDLLSS
ncbi:HLH-domain-containing protein [Ascobolus immersus RN42]|uniref:HLH-domain-containing protein n=1 Tax=Ascobolus immersus RN42 TaxID=1160509 RepID=A0A3N4I884_ASCIM|nr:HLH-domain-containing protein [Ascobolus immersus RN42]